MTALSPIVPATSGYAAFVNGFTFRFLRPEDPCTRSSIRAAAWCRRLGLQFDLLNTRFPAGSRELKAKLRRLWRVPRMSTPAVAAVINRGVAGMAVNEAFVNVGVWNGFTFLSGMIGNANHRCIGVDNFSEFGGPRDAFLSRFKRFQSPKHEFHDMDYKAYFATVHQAPIGFYLYDGEHSYQNQLDGLRVAEPFFGPNCVVMVDDTNAPEPRQATYDFVNGSPHRYETILDVTTGDNHHPTWWNGIMLLRRLG